MQELRSRLEAIARARIYFGHHSVGDDLLRGFGLVAERLGARPLPIMRVANGQLDAPPHAYFAEGRVGSNGDPRSKVADFAAHVARLPREIDLVFMKFCYVDFDPGTDSAALFDAYWEATEAIEIAHPRPTLLHVTVPLMTRDRRIRSRLKALLGRPVYRDLANQRRDDYNRLLRARCDPARLIGLARFESTAPDGLPVTVERDGEPRPYLPRRYARDEGHLNDAGAEHCASRLIRVLGACLAERTSDRVSRA